MAVSPESQQRIEALLRSALKLDPAQRSSFLDRACAGDLSVRQQVESKLAAYSNETGPVEPSLPEAATAILDSVAAAIIGRTISHYRILGFLGRGGMGEVYLAQDTKLGRKVALKLLPMSLNSDEERLRRFEREARSASALNHPNVSVIHEIGETEDGRHFIAMEHIDGVTLRGRLKEGPLTLTEALAIAVQIAAALSAAHKAGVVHRDIKPENIMLRHDGYVKVLDFGLAKLTERYDLGSDSEAPTFHAFSTHSGLLIGTANYLSPEQARRQEADERSDIWSLGVVLYEIVTGCLPFMGDTPSHTIVAILERDPAPLTQLLPTVPAELEWVVKKALRKDREQRYQTVKELIGDLNEVKQSVLDSASGRPLIMTGQSRERAVIQHSSALESISENLRRPRVSIAFLLLILLVIAGVWPLFRWYTRKAAAPFQNMHITKLTNTGQSMKAAVSPDGKYVAHVINEGGQQSLVVNYTATSSNVVVAPPSDARYLGLTFSHDGNYIYFVRNEKSDLGFLYRVPVLGGMTNKVLSNVDSPVALSPDDKQLTFVRYDKGEGEYSLMIGDAAGGGERKLTTRRNGDRFSIEGAPDWSPDGRSIICADGSFAGGFHMNVVVVQVADSSEKALPLPKWYGVLQAVWVNDGSGMIIAAAEESVSQIQLWFAPYPSGEIQRITNDSNDYVSISLTENSKELVAIQKNRQKAIWVAPNADANQARQVATAVGNTYGLAWASPARMIYSTMASGKLDLWSISADGNGRTQLTANAGSNYHPAVSADGHFIVFASNRTGTFNIWRMDADGSNPKQLTSGGSDFYPDISPDSRWVVYQSGGGASGKPTLWKVPIDGSGQPAQLTDLNTSVPAISPDGKWIACRFWDESDSSKKVAIVSFAGGAPTKTFAIPIHDWQRIRWTADAGALTYIDIRGGVSNIWKQPVDGRPASQLTFFKADQIFSYDWSDDGKLLACERGLETTDVVVISTYK